jgi:hypothetical protein
MGIGKACRTDVSTGAYDVLLDLNPDGWVNENLWRMCCGLDVSPDGNVADKGRRSSHARRRFTSGMTTGGCMLSTVRKEGGGGELTS